MAAEDSQPATQQYSASEPESEDEGTGHDGIEATQRFEDLSNLSADEEEPSPPPPPPPGLVLTRITTGGDGESEYYEPREVVVPLDKQKDAFLGRAASGGGVNADFFDERRASNEQKVSSRHAIVRARHSGFYINMVGHTGGSATTASGTEFAIPQSSGDVRSASVRSKDGWLRLREGMIVSFGRHAVKKKGGDMEYSLYHGLSFEVSFQGECGFWRDNAPAAEAVPAATPSGVPRGSAGVGQPPDSPELAAARARAKAAAESTLSQIENAKDISQIKSATGNGRAMFASVQEELRGPAGGAPLAGDGNRGRKRSASRKVGAANAAAGEARRAAQSQRKRQAEHSQGDGQKGWKKQRREKGIGINDGSGGGGGGGSGSGKGRRAKSSRPKKQRLAMASKRRAQAELEGQQTSSKPKGKHRKKKKKKGE